MVHRSINHPDPHPHLGGEHPLDERLPVGNEAADRLEMSGHQIFSVRRGFAPGMSVEAYLRTGERSRLSYFVKTLADYFECMTPADIPADATTTAEVEVGRSFSGTLETAGDVDRIKVTLEAGRQYEFSLEGVDDPGTTRSAVRDPLMDILDADGKRLILNNDGGKGLDSKFWFVAPESGTYYVEASANPSWNGGHRNDKGDYRLTVRIVDPRTEGSLDELAHFLTERYFAPRKFNLGSNGLNPKDGVITYTLDGWHKDPDGLMAARAELVREAFKVYGAILGIDFRETPSGDADIRFRDNGGGDRLTAGDHATRAPRPRTVIGPMTLLRALMRPMSAAAG